MRLKISLAALVLCGTALAQTGTNFTLEESTLNSGGTPSQGVNLTSTSFSITLASIGDGVVATGLCEEQDIAGTTTTDSSTPTAAFFYLVTVENLVVAITDLEAIAEGVSVSRCDPGTSPGHVPAPGEPVFSLVRSAYG